MINIVLVDDHSNRARELQTYLQQADMQCHLYQSNQDLAQKLESQESDILLLRLSLSQADGFSVCRNIRSIYKGFIVLLAEVQDDIDEIVSLEMGADEYIAEPVNPRVLIARLHNLLRRHKYLQAPQITTDLSKLVPELHCGRLCLNKVSQECLFDGQPVELQQSEFLLLHYLANHPDRLLNREELLQNIRGIEYDGLDRSIDVAIARLRRHFATLLDANLAIVTVRAKGYIFSSEHWQ